MPSTKIVIPFSFAKAISFAKSFLSPPSVNISKYFFASFFILLVTTSNIAIKSVPCSVIEFVSSFFSKKATASWSKLSGETK